MFANKGGDMMRFSCSSVLLILAVFASTCCRAAEVSFGTFAIEGTFKSQDREKNAVKAYLNGHDLDCSLYDFGNASSYFVNGDFSTDLSSYHVSAFPFSVRNDGTPTGVRYFFARDGFELTNCPSNTLYRSGDNTVGVFRDQYEQEFVLVNLRNTYTKQAYLDPIPSFMKQIREMHPQAMLLVSYNGRLRGGSAAPDPYASQADYLHDFLTSAESGPQLTCLGRGEECGFYTDSASQAKCSGYSVADVVLSDLVYTGAVVRITIPTRHRIVFTDWDDTVIQTNIVVEGASVVPPTPTRAGFTFAGWDGHPMSDFESVTADFVAKAVYSTSGNVVTFLAWDGAPLAEVSVADGETVSAPMAPVRTDHDFVGWRDSQGRLWNFAYVVTESVTLTASYELKPILEIDSVGEFLRLMSAGYPASEVYVISNDLDFAGATIAPVDFAGTLEGSGHLLSGIPAQARLFNSLSGVVKNLEIVVQEDLVEIGDSYGVLATTLSGAYLENVTVSQSRRLLRKTNGSLGVFASSAEADDEGNPTVLTNCTVRNSMALSTGAYQGCVFGGFVARATAAKFISCRFLTDNKSDVSVGGSIAVAAGGLVGRCSYPGLVEASGCLVEGVVQCGGPSGYYDGVGGLFGCCDGHNTDRPHYVVSSSTNRATLVAASTSRAGGLVGMASKTHLCISDCVNEGSIDIQGANDSLNSYHGAGGLLGSFWSNGGVTLEIQGSANRSDILLPSKGVPVGGLVGRVNSVSGISVTNSFNYGNVSSSIAAGGLVGRAETVSSYLFSDVGNAGRVTCSEGPAGGIIGYMMRGQRSTATFSGVMQAGDVSTGSSYAGNVVGFVPGRFYNADMIVADAVLAGSVSTASAEGQKGLVAGGVLSDADSTHEMSWSVSSVHSVDTALVPYYSRLNEPVVDVSGVESMQVSQLTSRDAVAWLRAGRAESPWRRGRSYPELAGFGTFPSGLLIIVK